MTSTAPAALEAGYDYTPLPNIVRSGIALGLLQSALVALFGFLQVRLDGVLELVVCGLILIVGLAVTIAMPGRWTRARTIEGIAGAAGIGFAAAIVFLVVDIALFQPLGLWTNRWLELGGGVNWWYHPVWWMVGTYLTGMGAWIQANQLDRQGRSSQASLIIGSFFLAILSLGIAVLVGFPGARFGLGGFAVAILPALALYTLISGLRPRRS